MGGRVFLANSFAKGEVRLAGADVHRDLDCHGSRFENSRGPALNADGIKVGGTVFLGCVPGEPMWFTAQGEVRLVDAEIGQALDCIGGTFLNESGYALNADLANWLRSSQYRGAWSGMPGCGGKVLSASKPL